MKCSDPSETHPHKVGFYHLGKYIHSSLWRMLKRDQYMIFTTVRNFIFWFFSIKQYFALKGQVKEEPNDFNIPCMPGHKLVWLYLHDEYVLWRIT